MARAAGNTPTPKARAQVLHTLGFGVPATSDPHHFKVVTPKASTGKVQISEHLGLQSASNDNAVIDRVLLDRPRWTAIRAEVQRAFNARLAAHGIVDDADIARHFAVQFHPRAAHVPVIGDEADRRDVVRRDRSRPDW